MESNNEPEELLELKQGVVSPDEEKELANFLKRIAVACKNDSSVPDVVGVQVQEWLKEMEDEAQVKGD